MARGSLPNCSQKLKHEFDNNLGWCDASRLILTDLRIKPQLQRNKIFFSRSESDSNGVIVPGFSTHSDLSISICIANVRLKSYLFTYQMSGDPITWS